MKKNVFDFVDNPLECLTTNDPYLILEVIEISDRVYQKILLDELIPKLDCTDADNYAIGYAYYLLYAINNKKESLEKSFYYLNKEVDKNVGNMYAKAYLAYASYEMQKLDFCLTLIKQIPFGYFSKKKQRWRDLDLEQIKICCLLRLNKLSNIEDEIFNYFIHISKTKEIDIPLPTELSNTLRTITSSH